MKPNTNLMGNRFQFSDSSKTTRAELTIAESGLILQLFDLDGHSIAEFHSPTTQRDRIVLVIMALAAFGHARMVIDSVAAR